MTIHKSFSNKKEKQSMKQAIEIVAKEYNGSFKDSISFLGFADWAYRQGIEICSAQENWEKTQRLDRKRLARLNSL